MMAEIPPGKGSDWQEREAWVLNPPSMSDRADPRPPGGTFTVPPVSDITTEVPRNASADHKTRDVYNLVNAGGTPQPPAPPPEEGGTATVQPGGTGAAQQSGTSTTVKLAAAPPVGVWEAMTRHAEIDEFVAASRQNLPDDWATMTIAQKKEWLDANFVVADESTAGMGVAASTTEN